MRGNNRKSIEKCRKRLPQFTTMNVIDGQAGLVIYSSLIFYSLTIDNILNIIVLLILAGVSIAMLTGDNGILTRVQDAKSQTEETKNIEKIKLAVIGSKITSAKGYSKIDEEELKKELKNQFGKNEVLVVRNNDMSYTIKLKSDQKEYDILPNGEIQQLNRIMSPTSVYAMIYSDGTLTFNTTGNINQDKIDDGLTVMYNTKNDVNIGNITKTRFESENSIPWIDYIENIKYIEIEEPIAPYITDYWFANLVNVEEINLENLYTNNTTTMKGMFYKCAKLKKIDLKHFNTENVLNFEWMFGRCYKLESINLCNFDTAKAKSLTAMFYDDKNLSEILVSNKWQINTENVTSMFTNCKADHVTYT